MNNENLEYLKERLFFLGFGDRLHAELERNMKAGKEQFTLSASGEFRGSTKTEAVDYAIDVGKSKTNDQYFLNKYQATLKADSPEQEKSQTFFLNKGNGVTAKEAFNLLEGRAVHKKLVSKEGQPYEAWQQIDFNQKTDSGNFKIQSYYPKWGFDVEKGLSKHLIKEAKDELKKEELIKSLSKGNIVPATLQRGENDEKVFLQANPRDRSVDVYDANMRKQFQGIKEYKGEGKGEKTSQENSETKETKKEHKQEPDEGERKTRSRKMSA